MHRIGEKTNLTVSKLFSKEEGQIKIQKLKVEDNKDKCRLGWLSDECIKSSMQLDGNARIGSA